MDSRDELLIDIKTKADIGALIECVAMILIYNFNCPTWWILWRLGGLLGCLAVRWWCDLKLTDSIVEINVHGNNNEIHIR